jgi:hypothetical protein
MEKIGKTIQYIIDRNVLRAKGWIQLEASPKVSADANLE